MTKEDFDLWIHSPLTQEFIKRLHDSQEQAMIAMCRIAAVPEKLHILNELRGQIQLLGDMSSPDELEKLLVFHEGQEI